MFLIETISEEQATGEVKVMYDRMREALGFVPPHFELFATIDIEGLKEFFDLNIYLQQHPAIDAEILPYLRLYIAKQENRAYCTAFNTKLLLARKAPKDIIRHITEQFDDIPLDAKQILLGQKVLKGIYDTANFGKEDVNELYALGFSDRDFYDLLNYATIFMAKSKMIDLYRLK